MKIYSGTTTLSNDGLPSDSKWTRPVKRSSDSSDDRCGKSLRAHPRFGVQPITRSTELFILW